MILFLSSKALDLYLQIVLTNLQCFVIYSRYDNTNGVFTVPDGAAGLYFISTHLVTAHDSFARFTIFRNNELLCEIFGESLKAKEATGCSVTTEMDSGKEN